MTETIGIEMVPLLYVSTDRTYQRQPSAVRINRMADSYDEKLANVVIMSRRRERNDKGKKEVRTYVVDGRHRVGAARKAGRTHILAAVYEGLSVADEARMFAELNHTPKPVTAIDRFKARLVYEDPDAVKLKALVEEHGGRIATGTVRGEMKDTFRAISASEAIVRRYGWTLLGQAFDIIATAYGKLDYEHAPVYMLRALANLLSSQRITKTAMIEGLRAMPPGAIKQAISAMIASGEQTYGVAAAEVILLRIHDAKRKEDSTRATAGVR